MKKWKNRGRLLKQLFLRELLSRRKLGHTPKVTNWDISTVVLKDLLSHWKKGFYLNQKSWEADALWMYLRFWMFTALWSCYNSSSPTSMFSVISLTNLVQLCWTFLVLYSHELEAKPLFFITVHISAFRSDCFFWVFFYNWLELVMNLECFVSARTKHLLVKRWKFSDRILVTNTVSVS